MVIVRCFNFSFSNVSNLTAGRTITTTRTSVWTVIRGAAFFAYEHCTNNLGIWRT